MKFLLDMYLPPALVPALREAGIEATHWSSVGNPGATDSVVLASARESGAVLVTHDLDFGALLAAGALKAPSVIQLRTRDLTPAAYAPLLIAAIHQSRDALQAGALVTVSEAEARMRILPLRRDV